MQTENIVGLGEDDFRLPLYGEITFSTQGDSTSVAQFAKVHNKKYDEHLMRFFADKVWELPRPDVMSVAGWADSFKLSATHKDRIMKDMMDGTRNLKPWFMAGGTNSDVMKYEGEARAKYNPHAPLIGIAPLTFPLIFRSEENLCHRQAIQKCHRQAIQHQRFGSGIRNWARGVVILKSLFFFTTSSWKWMSLIERASS